MLLIVLAFNDEHIALACSSHSGEAEHLRVAAEMLAKIGCDETDYECGSQWPERMDDKAQLIKASQGPRAIHNNCSGKHAGMLAYAKHMGVAFNDYVSIVHPVQKAVAKVIESYCDVDVSQAPHGIDGCSVPTWALPLQNTAIGFARLFASENAVGTRIARAVRNNPFLVAGTGRFDTNIMNAVPRLFIKVGAEGVFCGAIPHADLGFALKIDDGAVRGAEVSIARVLAQLNCWTNEELNALEPFTYSTLRNWRKLEVGATQSSF